MTTFHCNDLLVFKTVRLFDLRKASVFHLLPVPPCIYIYALVCVVSDPMLGGSGHVSESLIAIVLGPVCAALLVAVVVFVVVKLHASRRRRRQRLEHGNQVYTAAIQLRERIFHNRTFR